MFLLINIGGKSGNELLTTWSLWKSSEKLFKTTKDGGELGAINGLRTVSTWWVVMGHRYSYFLKTPIVNIVDAIDVIIINNIILYIDGL